MLFFTLIFLFICKRTLIINSMDKRKSKPILLPVDDILSDSSSGSKHGAKQVVSDSEESYEEFGEDEIEEDNYEGLAPHNDDDPSESDISLSSSEDEILLIKKKLDAKHSKQ